LNYLSRDVGAAFAATSAQDCSTCTGAHPLTKAMLFVPTSIVRLKCAFSGHDGSKTSFADCDRFDRWRSIPQGAQPKLQVVWERIFWAVWSQFGSDTRFCPHFLPPTLI